MEMYRSTCVKMLDFQVPASFQLFSIDCQRKPMTLKFCFSTSSVWIWTSRQNMKSFFALSQTQHQQDSESYLVGHVHLDLDEIVARRLRRPWKSTKNTFVTRALNKKHVKQKLYTLWSMRWEKWRNDTKRWNLWIIWCIDCISPITCCVVSGPPDHGQDCILACVCMCSCGSYMFIHLACRALKSQVQALARKEQVLLRWPLHHRWGGERVAVGGFWDIWQCRVDLVSLNMFLNLLQNYPMSCYAVISCINA